MTPDEQNQATVGDILALWQQIEGHVASVDTSTVSGSELKAKLLLVRERCGRQWDAYALPVLRAIEAAQAEANPPPEPDPEA